ncbi:MAG TPA: energy transducer TonB [Kofleriaceae bacterium]
MRRVHSLVAALLIIPALAAADTAMPPANRPPPPSPQPALDVMRKVIDAVGAGRAKDLRALLGATVTVDGLSFRTTDCDRAFGARKIKVTKRDALVKCLMVLSPLPTWDKPTIQTVRGGFIANLELSCASYTFALRGSKGALSVAAITARITCTASGDDTDELGGEVGGLLDGTMPPPPPPPRPSDAVLTPQNVPTRLLEGIRIAGDKIIVPDDATKVAITQSGKAKVVASLKLCIDATGVVTHVTVLKSSGFPDYDAKLKREMQLWKYKPYLVNRRPVPVCTAVTFIYSQA